MSKKKLLESTIEKNEILLLIDDLIDVLTSYTGFCKLLEKFIIKNKPNFPDNIKKQYLENVREEYNDFFARFRDFSKRTWRKYGVTKDIPNLKLPLIW